MDSRLQQKQQHQEYVDEHGDHIPIVTAVPSPGDAAYSSAALGRSQQPLPPPVNPEVVTIDDPDDAGMSTENTPLIVLPPVYSSDGSIAPGTATGNIGNIGSSGQAFHEANGNTSDIGNTSHDNENGQGSNEPYSTSSSMFRDWLFGLVWLLHFAVLLYAFLIIAPQGYTFTQHVNRTVIDDAIHNNNNNNSNDDDMTAEDIERIDEFLDFAQQYIEVYPARIFWYMAVPCAEVAVLVTFLYTYFILRPCARAHVNFMLVGTVVVAALLAGIVVLVAPSLAVAATAVVPLVGPAAYFVYKLRPLVPFAAVNLKVALAGVSANSGVYLVALAFAEIGFAWFLFWLYTTVGTMTYLDNECKTVHDMTTTAAQAMASRLTASSDSSNGSNGSDTTIVDSNSHSQDCDNNQGWFFLAFLVSLYWTSTLIVNLLQVTVAGVMATWCFDKDSAQWCCSSAVYTSLLRACTWSFGSVSLGSLLQGFITVIRIIVKQQTRPNAQYTGNNGCCNGSILGCGLECIARAMEKLLNYFNHWAYVYVGIYGCTYIESGKSVFKMFRSKGWNSIVTDQLVTYVLRFTSLMLGITTGVLAIVIDRVVTIIDDRFFRSDHMGGDDDIDGSFDPDASIHERSFVFGPISAWPLLAFLIGLAIGKIVSSIMLNVVKGAVNTLIVCWADSPDRMTEVHPVLAVELAETWALAFPDEYTHVYRRDGPWNAQQPQLAAAAVYS